MHWSYWVTDSTQNSCSHSESFASFAHFQNSEQNPADSDVLMTKLLPDKMLQCDSFKLETDG